MTKLNKNNAIYVIQTMTSINYFDSSRKNLTYFEWKSVIMEMHVITKSTNLDVYSSFPTLITIQ